MLFLLSNRFLFCSIKILKLIFFQTNLHYFITAKDLNDIDPDDMCDDAMGSDLEGSETDSKISDSKKGDGKSQGGNSKPRR